MTILRYLIYPLAIFNKVIMLIVNAVMLGFCERSNFDHSHRNAMSPLILCELYCSNCDDDILYETVCHKIVIKPAYFDLVIQQKRGQ